jgi:Na+/proline symporter
MVATSFAADTPLVITGWVREAGVWKNWLWWCFAISNGLGVFIFARLWRRGEVLTKAELAELRYGPKDGKALRSVLGVLHAGFTNTIVLCWVLLAFAKIADVLLGMDKGVALVGASSVALAYAVMAGFWGVVITDLVQFVMAVVGAIALAVFSWEAVGGIPRLLESGALDPAVTAIFPQPANDGSLLDAGFWTTALAVVAINLGVGWWAQESVDGSSVTVQRVAAAKDERQGSLAVLWYSFVHYALRPWPWIVVAVASLVLVPQLEVKSPVSGVVTSVDAREIVVEVTGNEEQASGTGARPQQIIALDVEGSDTNWAPRPGQADIEVGSEINAGDIVARTDPERAYVVMMARYLPAGFLGLVVASLLAAFMSTIDTHVNLAASFFTHDLYRARWAPNEDDRHYVRVARWSSAAVMAIACAWAFAAESIGGLFTFLLAFLGGVGPIYLLRWMWWRVQARAEIAAMVASGLTTTLLALLPLTWPETVLSPGGELIHEARLLIVVAVSTTTALLALALGVSPDPAARVEFYRRFRPPGWWGPVKDLAGEVQGEVGWRAALLGWLSSILGIYGLMLAVGWALFGQLGYACAAALVGLPAGLLSLRIVLKGDAAPELGNG